MKKKEYNRVDYSTLIPKEHRLLPGKVAEFRLLGIKQDKVNPGKWVMPNVKGVPREDRIVTKDGSVEWIAPVKNYDHEDNPVMHEIMFTRSGSGRLYFNGSNPDDVDQFNYLYAANWNATNKNRDKSKTALYEFIDKKAKAQAELESMNDQMKAVQFLSKMKDEDITEIATSRGWVEDDFEVMKAKVWKFAMDSPSDFLAVSKSPSREVESVVNRALKRSKIRFVARDRKFTYTGNDETILIVPQKDKKNATGYLVAWLMKDEQGRVVYDHIQKLLATETIEME